MCCNLIQIFFFGASCNKYQSPCIVYLYHNGTHSDLLEYKYGFAVAQTVEHWPIDCKDLISCWNCFGYIFFITYLHSRVWKRVVNLIGGTLPSCSFPSSSAACPEGRTVLTKIPIIPLGESRPPTIENPRLFLPGPFSKVTVWKVAWLDEELV